MTAETANQVRKLCLAIRTRTNNYSVDIKHWVRDLDELRESGWSPQSLPMMQLMADAETLQNLADRLVSMQCVLTQPEKPNESA